MTSATTPIDSDILEGLRDLFGDEFDSLLADYLLEAPDLAAQIAAAVEQGNAALATAAAHQLKATSATFGALALTEIAEQIESQALAPDLSGCRQLVERCLDEAERVTRVLVQAP